MPVVLHIHREEAVSNRRIKVRIKTRITDFAFSRTSRADCSLATGGNPRSFIAAMLREDDAERRQSWERLDGMQPAMCSANRLIRC
jgi:hypothetical protein